MHRLTRVHRTGPSVRWLWEGGAGWPGIARINAVGAVQEPQVGMLMRAGKDPTPVLRFVLSTSTFFPEAPLPCDLTQAAAALKTCSSTAASPPPTGTPDTITGDGHLYTVDVNGPSAFLAKLCEVLTGDVLVELSGRLHVTSYTYWRAGTHMCPTVRLSHEGLRSTAETLTVLHAPPSTEGRQNRLHRVIFTDVNV
ncbi:hypothetical protein NESM_000598900 [Novymonas esmeraldas]|uniref:Uncharacterized protein n=1 Tax=Novymonas esmeraldas TaxID=1808958 RepID=A0AAW0EUD4_9TRYP